MDPGKSGSCPPNFAELALPKILGQKAKARILEFCLQKMLVKFLLHFALELLATKRVPRLDSKAQEPGRGRAESKPVSSIGAHTNSTEDPGQDPGALPSPSSPLTRVPTPHN